MSDLATLVDFLTTVPDNPHFTADTLMIAGNSLTELIRSAAEFCEAEPSIQQVVFIGGIGHGTKPLINHCRKEFPELIKGDWELLSEAEITQAIFKHYCQRPLNFRLEKASTNTGENARFSRQLFQKEAPKTFWLLQDPLLQKRTHLTFSKEWDLPLTAIQPLSFEQPRLRTFTDRPHFANPQMDNWWSTEYFLSLVVGEIRRLYDTEEGYGPNGTGFIPHVDLPTVVLSSYRRCQKYLAQDLRN
ncbi:ElyC/SanA/YdcF family protein [Enterococcus pseudoavium]|uniref:ElyC/SanA/YdcF family protein n=1 Tax=Enterococcus pseudoavium TaxID=44007 RepID=UPI00083253AD|nr:ElyC/SanA/YdcF family protein [Enterococcus pseudoavium]